MSTLTYQVQINTDGIFSFRDEYLSIMGVPNCNPICVHHLLLIQQIQPQFLKQMDSEITAIL